VDTGITPGSARGVDLTPVYEYQHPLNLTQRSSDGHLDVGAFEFVAVNNGDSGDGDDGGDGGGDGGSDIDSGNGDSGDAGPRSSGSSSGKGCFLSALIV
jgi:hypothetical protein